MKRTLAGALLIVRKSRQRSPSRGKLLGAPLERSNFLRPSTCENTRGAKSSNLIKNFENCLPLKEILVTVFDEYKVMLA